jgi:hypothetical protein
MNRAASEAKCVEFSAGTKKLICLDFGRRKRLREPQKSADFSLLASEPVEARIILTQILATRALFFGAWVVKWPKLPPWMRGRLIEPARLIVPMLQRFIASRCAMVIVTGRTKPVRGSVGAQRRYSAGPEGKRPIPSLPFSLHRLI